MEFASDRAFLFLMEHGVVATMRWGWTRSGGWRYRPGATVDLTRRGKKFATGIVVDAVPNTPENRSALLPLSGYTSVAEWVRAEKRRHQGRLPNAIVVVEVVDIPLIKQVEQDDSKLVLVWGW